MAEQPAISYKPLGFRLGLGGGAAGAGSSGTAASALLDTLLTSVPTAKALLPTLVPELAKAKAAAPEALAVPSQRNAPASKPAPAAAAPQQQPSSSPKREAGAKQPPPASQPPALEASANGAAKAGPGPEVIDLLSDSESEQAAAAPSRPAPKGAAAATAAVGSKSSPVSAAPTAGVNGSSGAVAAKPPPSDFIPLAKVAPAAAPAGGGGRSGAAAAAAAPPAAAAPGSADALADEEKIRQLGQRPYWMSYVSCIASPMLRLHQELVELCELVQPTPEEAEARRAAVEAVTGIVTSIWPNARCEVFGSYATGLYVPTSDIDLVILGSGCTNIQGGLKALASALQKKNVGTSLQLR
ncbi:hypothetical protein GPECTOR_11g20 [Gonium pectorale]|uniref:Poly(A) RNA polymerase mitochondrial-like central palm domain-containing protein n=1 Tax=Gonium pectorale TaxID=33097 RepID=A0A150GPM5_GONPE|nr:hypothetical protein GPECTOR_11g20 [Gonium pectorale]|eukprot:KXZ51755.1 hypothetical protein GPECTOR_11g20 [Gonium pectorale]